MLVVEPRADGVAVCAGADGGRAEVLTQLVEPVGAGDSLLVHAGVALVRL
jgi:hydrogenase maturation factor